MSTFDTGNLVGEILQFMYQNKWTIAVLIPIIIAIIVVKIRG